MLSQWLKELNTVIQCLAIKPKAIKIHDTHIKNTYIEIHNLYMTHFVGISQENYRVNYMLVVLRKTKLLLLRKIIVPYQRESLALVAYV